MLSLSSLTLLVHPRSTVMCLRLPVQHGPGLLTLDDVVGLDLPLVSNLAHGAQDGLKGARLPEVRLELRPLPSPRAWPRVVVALDLDTAEHPVHCIGQTVTKVAVTRVSRIRGWELSLSSQIGSGAAMRLPGGFAICSLTNGEAPWYRFCLQTGHALARNAEVHLPQNTWLQAEVWTASSLSTNLRQTGHMSSPRRLLFSRT